jgi:hypothetical protein
MTLGIRKLLVLGLIGVVVLLANFVIVGAWLSNCGVIDFAACICKEYLTGTAITIIVVLLILLVAPRHNGGKFVRRCRVCDHILLGIGSYCSECGSKTT